MAYNAVLISNLQDEKGEEANIVIADSPMMAEEIHKATKTTIILLIAFPRDEQAAERISKLHPDRIRTENIFGIGSVVLDLVNEKVRELNK